MTRLVFLLLASIAFAQKTLPPPGIPIPAEERESLEAELARLRAVMEPLRTSPYWADIATIERAVASALRYNEFYLPAEFARAHDLLAYAMERAERLAAGQSPWVSAKGLVPLGYISRLDDSIQPYGLVVPPSYSPDSPRRWRLDIWLHGRGDTLSELAFLWQRLTDSGQFTPRDTLVLHLYGRYCNASKFAGEVDMLEALADVKRRYAIDENRILVRGFSMGGASTWHLGAHFADLFAAAAPGAGFAETAQYQKMTPETLKAMPLWERQLFHWYDATDYAANFYQLPLVAYSGEKDKQIQAAQIMGKSLEGEGLTLTHVIGPDTEHKYHPAAKLEVARRMDLLAEKGRLPVPRKLRFVTYTLRYAKMRWLELTGLESHWDRARVEAEIREPGFFTLRTENVSAFRLNFEPGQYPFDPETKPTVTINGTPVRLPRGANTDLSYSADFHREGIQWVAGPAKPGLAKRPGLQGPIDDAFLNRFLFVRPTGQPRDPQLAAWAAAEMDRAIRRWRGIFRGEVRIKDDTQVTEADLAESNLILWGDAGSNQILARVADQLPLKAESGQALVMVYPNPLSPSRYVVLNSGFTFREDSDGTNSRQVPVLPDWALIDLSTPPNAHWPGKVLKAGFFDENWRLKP
ncbi:MAG: prolyl oligopeptidase family serine peptidase [Bryobacteraceae bacterium]|nr:prolyl oligopeptidase family serine peptidase [Bryobacteraceae bacterium]